MNFLFRYILIQETMILQLIYFLLCLLFFFGTVSSFELGSIRQTNATFNVTQYGNISGSDLSIFQYVVNKVSSFFVNFFVATYQSMKGCITEPNFLDFHLE